MSRDAFKKNRASSVSISVVSDIGVNSNKEIADKHIKNENGNVHKMETPFLFNVYKKKRDKTEECEMS